MFQPSRPLVKWSNVEKRLASKKGCSNEVDAVMPNECIRRAAQWPVTDPTIVSSNKTKSSDQSLTSQLAHFGNGCSDKDFESCFLIWGHDVPAQSAISQMVQRWKALSQQKGLLEWSRPTIVSSNKTKSSDQSLTSQLAHFGNGCSDKEPGIWQMKSTLWCQMPGSLSLQPLPKWANWEVRLWSELLGIELAKLLERGGINALFLADTTGGHDTYEGKLDEEVDAVMPNARFFVTAAIAEMG
jgi:hypothetical protein